MINYNIPITVIIPTKNNYNTLKFTLPILSSFNEVIIVDTFTNDGTKELVENLNFNYINFKWNGLYPKKRNWILFNVNIKNDWVLFLDSDEFINKDFIIEINKKINDYRYNAYVISFENEFLGKVLKWGDTFRKTSLIRHKYCKYEIVNDNFWTSFDMEVHENMIVKGKIGKIKSKVLHNSCDNLNHYINKHNEYAIWESKRHSTNSFIFSNYFHRRFLKYILFNSIFLPYLYFIYSYIFCFGFLDGKHGYVFALLKFSYFNNIRIRILASKL
jgi:glycosyltransferase involved in cell wall biosynthesis